MTCPSCRKEIHGTDLPLCRDCFKGLPRTIQREMYRRKARKGEFGGRSLEAAQRFLERRWSA